MGTEADFIKIDRKHPGYYLAMPGVDLGDDNYIKIEIDPYDVKTISKFLDVEKEEERDNRIRNLFRFLNRDYDDLSIERVSEYLHSKFKIKVATLAAIDKKIKSDMKIKTKESQFDIHQKILNVTGYIYNVELLHKQIPFFFDDSKLFWVWNKEKHKWKIVDDVDVMNLIDDQLQLGGETVTSSMKSNYLEAFKRVGRKNHPEDAKIKWIQFKDKAFSLKSGKIHQVTHHYFFCNPIPWELGTTSETPTIDKLFKEWVGEKYVPTLYEIIAYCCYAGYPIQTLFCLYGAGRNGKTCFLRLLTKFIGMENICSTDLDLIAGNNPSRFEIFKLYKKLGCLMGETNFGILNRSSVLKKLVGSDLIGFEKKGKDPFDEYSYAKVLIASNSLPSSADSSEGFYRRWIIVDFENTFPEGKDILKTIPIVEYHNLAKKVTEILPGLLEKGEFTNQGTIEERKTKYIMASNPLPFFVKKYCKEDLEGFIRYSEFYTSYVQYLKNHKKRIISKKEFSQSLDLEGIEIKKTSKKIGESWVNDRYIDGLRLLTDIENETEEIIEQIVPEEHIIS